MGDDDVICLSSDDETATKEPPIKKSKVIEKSTIRKINLTLNAVNGIKRKNQPENAEPTGLAKPKNAKTSANGFSDEVTIVSPPKASTIQAKLKQPSFQIRKDLQSSLPRFHIQKPVTGQGVLSSNFVQSKKNFGSGVFRSVSEFSTKHDLVSSSLDHRKVNDDKIDERQPQSSKFKIDNAFCNERLFPTNSSTRQSKVSKPPEAMLESHGFDALAVSNRARNNRVYDSAILKTTEDKNERRTEKPFGRGNGFQFMRSRSPTARIFKSTREITRPSTYNLDKETWSGKGRTATSSDIPAASFPQTPLHKTIWESSLNKATTPSPNIVETMKNNVDLPVLSTFQKEHSPKSDNMKLIEKSCSTDFPLNNESSKSSEIQIVETVAITEIDFSTTPADNGVIERRSSTPRTANIALAHEPESRVPVMEKVEIPNSNGLKNSSDSARCDPLSEMEDKRKSRESFAGIQKIMINDGQSEIRREEKSLEREVNYPNLETQGNASVAPKSPDIEIVSVENNETDAKLSKKNVRVTLTDVLGTIHEIENSPAKNEEVTASLVNPSSLNKSVTALPVIISRQSVVKRIIPTKLFAVTDPEKSKREDSGAELSRSNDGKTSKTSFVPIAGCSKSPDEKHATKVDAQKKPPPEESFMTIPWAAKTKDDTARPNGASKSSEATENFEKPHLVVKTKKPVVPVEQDTFAMFLSLCLQTDRSKSMEKIVSKLKRNHDLMDPGYSNSRAFSDFLNDKREKIMMRGRIFYYIGQVNEEMKLRKNHDVTKKQNKDPENRDEDTNARESANREQDETDQCSNTSRRLRQKIKTIEITMKKCAKRIRELEVAEVDFDEENNSDYLKLERYKRKMVELYTKMCEYTNEHADAGRAYLRPKHLRVTQIPSIDQAINSFVNSKLTYNRKEAMRGKSSVDGLIFPDYVDILECVGKVNEAQDLGLDKRRQQKLAESAFTQLGKHLQDARQRDYWDTFSLDLEKGEDPATADHELSEKLSQNQKIGEKNMKAIFEEYVKKQEAGYARRHGSSSSSEADNDESEEDDEKSSRSAASDSDASKNEEKDRSKDVPDQEDSLNPLETIPEASGSREATGEEMEHPVTEPAAQEETNENRNNFQTIRTKLDDCSNSSDQTKKMSVKNSVLGNKGRNFEAQGSGELVRKNIEEPVPGTEDVAGDGNSVSDRSNAKIDNVLTIDEPSKIQETLPEAQNGEGSKCPDIEKKVPEVPIEDLTDENNEVVYTGTTKILDPLIPCDKLEEITIENKPMEIEEVKSKPQCGKESECLVSEKLLPETTIGNLTVENNNVVGPKKITNPLFPSKKTKEVTILNKPLEIEVIHEELDTEDAIEPVLEQPRPLRIRSFAKPPSSWASSQELPPEEPGNVERPFGKPQDSASPPSSTNISEVPRLGRVERVTLSSSKNILIPKTDETGPVLIPTKKPPINGSTNRSSITVSSPKAAAIPEKVSNQPASGHKQFIGAIKINTANVERCQNSLRHNNVTTSTVPGTLRPLNVPHNIQISGTTMNPVNVRIRTLDTPQHIQVSVQQNVRIVPEAHEHVFKLSDIQLFGQSGKRAAASSSPSSLANSTNQMRFRGIPSPQTQLPGKSHIPQARSTEQVRIRLNENSKMAQYNHQLQQQQVLRLSNGQHLSASTEKVRPLVASSSQARRNNFDGSRFDRFCRNSAVFPAAGSFRSGKLGVGRIGNAPMALNASSKNEVPIGNARSVTSQPRELSPLVSEPSANKTSENNPYSRRGIRPEQQSWTAAAPAQAAIDPLQIIRADEMARKNN